MLRRGDLRYVDYGEGYIRRYVDRAHPGRMRTYCRGSLKNSLGFRHKPDTLLDALEIGLVGGLSVRTLQGITVLVEQVDN